VTTRSGQATIQDSMGQVLEAVIKEMVEPGPHPKPAWQTEGAVTAALVEELKQSLAHTVSEGSPFEKAIFVATLAPALAEALAPALAEALAPALVEALSKMATPKETRQESAPGQESAPDQGANRPEGE
jgi:hypothetical protein